MFLEDAFQVKEFTSHASKGSIQQGFWDDRHLSTAPSLWLLPVPLVALRPLILLHEAATVPRAATPLHLHTVTPPMPLSGRGCSHLTPSPAVSPALPPELNTATALCARPSFNPPFPPFPSLASTKRSLPGPPLPPPRPLPRWSTELPTNAYAPTCIIVYLGHGLLAQFQADLAFIQWFSVH